MCQDTSDLLNLKDEIKKYKQELSYLLEISKQNEKLIENAQDSHPLKREINYLKKEIKSLKEINSKTIDFLLLKIESNLDMQKQLIFNQDFNLNTKGLIDVGKDDNFEFMDDDAFSDFFKLKINEYINIIHSKNQEINSLNKKLVELTNKLEGKSSFIDNILSQNEIYDDFADIVDFWEAKFNFLKKESKEKDETINSLNEEISILKSIIVEKDNMIDSLNR